MKRVIAAKFKEAQVGYVPDGWVEMPLGDAVDFNPKRKLEKGRLAKYVAMTDIEPFTKNIRIFKLRNFLGGSKFRNGDTLMARITPCLENGKTAFVDFLDHDEIAAGSTEFIVLCGKENVSDSDFVYYLSINPSLRKAAIKAMTGTSGRQRVENDKIASFLFQLPSLIEQKQIVKILSSLDDKIELNRKISVNLEILASTLFKKWFIDIGDELPEGWRVTTLKEVLTLNYGKALKAEDRKNGQVKVFGSSGFIGFHDTKLVDGPGIIVGRKGNVGSVFWSDQDFYPIDTTYFITSELPLTYCYFLLKTQSFVNGDSVVPGLNRDQAYRTEIFLPNAKILNKFDAIATDLFNSVASIEKENEKLSSMRDSLLPRLMSGKIRTKI
ncbi:MAG: restriction endonuclease subunit S [Nitrospirota bacterium]